jgi:hypothetical protein
MRISKIATDGSARDDALKRRNASMRDMLGMNSASSREANKPQELKDDEKSDAIEQAPGRRSL